MTDPEPASSPCQAPPGYWGEEESDEKTTPAGEARPADQDRDCPGSETAEK
jgi:hypothetical protein